MKSRALWTVSVITTAQAEDAVTELLQEYCRQPAASYTDVETGKTTVTVYLAEKPKAFSRSRDELLAGLARLPQCGLNAAPTKIACRKMRREDWAESWKRHFQPIEIGQALMVKPSWSRRLPRKGQAVVVLDPGLSFGTGQHPTTGFCLQELVVRRKRSASFLDVGTGSGILAIAAAKLGYSPVQAFDFDPEAVRVASANARKNRVSRRVRLLRGDVTKLPLRTARRYDLICANLISTLLVTERRRILSRLKRGGVLVLAGILKTEFSLVQRAYETAGLKLIAGRTEKEWRSGTFARA